MNSTLTRRTRQRHFVIDLPDEVIAELVGKNQERIDHYAELWMSEAKHHYNSLKEYCDFVANIMKGLAPIPEIKRELRTAIFKLEKKARGGF